MDDIRICSNQSATRDKISFDIRMIQNITPIYAKKVLEQRYMNRLYGNLYVTGVDQIELASSICQHPNDNTFVIDVAYSLVGTVYFKDMKLAFCMDNLINVNGVSYFQKGNVFAIINNLEIDEKEKKINGVERPLLIVRVIVEPSYWPESNTLRVGLICDLDRLIDDTPETRIAYNVIVD